MKAVLQIVLWIVIIFLGYLIYHSIEDPIEFQKVKKERYAPVIHKLKDIRKSELAYKDVTGHYTGSFPKLVQFIDTAQFVITEKRDTSYLDKQYLKVYGVDHYIQDVIVDTLGYASVRDSLFGTSNRYKTMMYVPFTDKKHKFDLEADSIYNNDSYLPVFEAKVDKAIVLEGQNENLIKQEKQVQSVEDISGPYIKVGSLNKVNTNGNWPKNYGKSDQ